MADYNPDDVKAVALAVLSIEPYLIECSSDYRICPFCEAAQGVSYHNGVDSHGSKFPHSLDCPTLIAQDLLTGGV